MEARCPRPLPYPMARSDRSLNKTERLFALVLLLQNRPNFSSRALAEHFGSIDALLAADEEEIQRVDGVGPILAEQIVEQFSDERTLELIERLRGHGLRLELEESERRGGG